MAFPTNPTVIDAFAAPSGPPIGAPWNLNKIQGGGDNGLQSSGGGVVSSPASGNGFVDTVYGPDCEWYLDVLVLPSGGSYYFLVARLKDQASATFDCYGLIYIVGAPNTWQLRRYDNGSSTVIASSTAVTLSIGDGIGLGVVGSQVTGYARQSGVWSAVLTVVDATYPAAGYMGLEIGDTSAQLDNASGGTVIVVAGDAPTPVPPMFHGRGAC